MKILIIEDDLSFAATLVDILKKDYIISSVSKGMDGQYLVETGEYDLVILDLDLPDMSGITICCNLRKKGIDVPILILSGELETNTKVKLLDCGADDYLTKPFNQAELLARVRALVRRNGRKIVSYLISTKDIQLDTEKKSVVRENKEISLRRKEYHLLEYFMRNAGKVLTRSMILDNVWDDEPEALTNVVDVHIKYLRDRIDRPFDKKHIKTIHGLGYRFDP